MRWYRVRVQNYRQLQDYEVTFADSGVTVIEGPNESGKSGIVAAISVLIDHKDNSKKKTLVAMKPVDSQGDPMIIEAEFSLGGQRLLYRKQWFSRPKTSVEFIEPAQKASLTGEEAHNFVANLVATHTDQVLRNAMVMLNNSGSAAQWLDSAALKNALDAASAGESSHSAETDSLMANVERQYLMYFTAGKGQPTGEYKTISEQLTQYRQEVEDFEARVRACEDDEKRYEALGVEARALDTQLTESQERARQLAEEHTQAEAIAERVMTAEKDLSANRLEAARAREAQQIREQLIISGKQLHDELTEHQRNLEELADKQRFSRSQADSAREARDVAMMALQNAQAVEDFVQDDYQYHGKVAEIATQRRRRETLGVLSRKRIELSAKIQRDAIDANDLAELDECYERWRRAEIRTTLENSTLTIESPEEIVIDIDGQSHCIAAGIADERPVINATSLTLPSGVVVRVTPGQTGESAARELSETKEQLDQILRKVGVAHRDAALTRHEVVAQLERELSSVTEQFDELREEQSLDDIDQHIELLDDEVHSYQQQRRMPELGNHQVLEVLNQWSELPVDLTDAEGRVTTINELIDNLDAQAKDATTTYNAMSELLHESEVALAALQATADSVKSSREQADNELRTVRSKVADTEIASALRQAESAVEKAERFLTEAQNRAQQVDLETVTQLAASAQEAVHGLRHRADELREQRISLKARLQQIGVSGLHAKHTQARGTLAVTQRRYDALHDRAQAARRLRNTLRDHREAAHQRYLAPFEDRLNKFGRIVFGSSCVITVADDLSIASRTLNGKRVDYSELSTGAKEQLDVLMRLACAQLVSSGDGVPVVLDDTTAHSDPERLARLNAAFAAAGNAQVIVLTCTPNAHIGVPGATTVRMPTAL